MTKLDRLSEMEKNAVAPTWLRNTGKALGVGAGIYFGSQMGKSLGQDAAALSHKGKIGLGSEARWRDEHENLMRKSIDPEKLRSAEKRRNLVGIGGLAGGLGVSRAITHKPLVNIGAGLIGMSLGRWLSKVRSRELRALEMDPMKASLGEVAGAFGVGNLKSLNEVLSSPTVQENPELKQHIIARYSEAASQRPEYKRYQKKKKTGAAIGGILGGLSMVAAMKYGKNTAKGQLGPTKFQKALGGSTYWPWAGLSVGALGLGVAKTLEGGRRANIDPKETRKKALQKAVSQGGMSLMFYGGGPR